MRWATAGVMSLATVCVACSGTGPAGEVFTIAGGPESGDVDGVGREARFHGPVDLALAEDGTIYVVDAFNHRIRHVAPDGTTTTLAGGEQGFRDGPVGDARFSVPAALLILDGTLLIADSGNHSIRQLDLGSREVTVFAGGRDEAGFVDGRLEEARFNLPYGLALDAERGQLWVVDKGNNAIRQIDLGAGEVRTIAGGAGGGTTDGTGIEARFNSPSGIAIDGSGGAYVCDTANSIIRHVDGSGVVRTAAGSALRTGSADGPPDRARLNRPWGIARVGDGFVFSEQWNNTLRRFVPDVHVRWLAGRAWDGGIASERNRPTPHDGPADEARLSYPTGVAMGATGEILFVDQEAVRGLRGWEAD